MRIIHAHKYFYKRRGAEHYMLDLMNMQEQDGHQVVPFSMQYPKNLPSAWDGFFVSEIQTEQGSRNLYQALKQIGRALWSWEAKRKFEKLVDAFNPDIVHAHNLYTHISPSILKVCQQRNIPVVMSVHDYALVSADYALWNPILSTTMSLDHIGLLQTARTKFIKGSYLATFVLEAITIWHRLWGSYQKRIDRFFPNSQFMSDVLVDQGFAKEKMRIMYPFTDLPEYTKYRDEGFVLFLGALEDYKGVQTLIKAMKAFPNVNLKIAGTGPYEKKLRALSKNMSNIEFVGFVSGAQREDLMSKARVCVVPSLWYEPFGLVAVEVMARMTPVIVSDMGGLKEIVEPGVSGEVFIAGDVESLIEKMKPFVLSADHAESYAESARDRALILCDPQDHYQKMMEEYKEVIGKNESK